MSDTPETDAESCYPDSNLGECVCADFARKLERERNESLEELKPIRQRTPETDDFELNLGDYSNPWKAIEFARKFERERDEARTELEEAQLCLKKAITELDLASVEIFKWERDFMIVVNDFKTVVKQLNK